MLEAYVMFVGLTTLIRYGPFVLAAAATVAGVWFLANGIASWLVGKAWR